MKKTIVAAAIAAAVAAPAAMADVSVSGFVLQEFITNEDNSGTETGGASAVDINFKATEDLGNGMKATAFIGSSMDNGGAWGSNDQTVELSGGFGSIKMGRMEPLIEGSVASQASIGAAAENMSIEVDDKSGKRADGGLRYTTPSMNGLTVSVEAFTDVSAQSGLAAGNVNGEDFALTAAMVSYKNAGLTVRAAAERVQGGNDTNAIAVIYSMGDLSARVVHQASETNAGVEHDATMYGMNYTMGANKFGIGKLSTDTADGDDMLVGVTHSLSKNTSVGLTHEFEDGSTDDRTAVTVTVKF